MLRFAGKKLLAVIPLLLILSFVSYVLVDLIPGDAAASIAGDRASPAQLAALREHLGLNDPLPVRYVRFLDNAVHGDLGRSVINSQPVSETIAHRLPVTLSLLLVTLLLIVIVSVPVGMVAALRPNSLVDRAVTVIAGVILSVPSFVVGLLLVTYLAVDRSWFPATGYHPLGQGRVALPHHPDPPRHRPGPAPDRRAPPPDPRRHARRPRRGLRAHRPRPRPAQLGHRLQMGRQEHRRHGRHRART